MKREFLELLKENLGVTGFALNKLKIEPGDFMQWLEQDEEFKNEFAKISHEALLENAEAILKKAKEGDVNALIYCRKNIHSTSVSLLRKLEDKLKEISE